MRFSYQGNIVTSYLIQANSTVSAVQCKGTFGATCSSDGTTLVQPAYRHTAGMGWLFDKGVVQFDWPYRQGAFEHGGFDRDARRAGHLRPLGQLQVHRCGDDERRPLQPLRQEPAACLDRRRVQHLPRYL
jgi:hypothetical protein